MKYIKQDFSYNRKREHAKLPNNAFRLSARKSITQFRLTFSFSVNSKVFKENEDIAKISAMVLDGCILKDLKSCMFAQKKDRSKVTEFSNIVKNLFDVTGNFYIDKRTNTSRIDYPRKALVNFFYFCLDIHKCDESARIPYWIWNSPRSVIIEYLRYAFAMEGSIGRYLKGTEIKFHSVDLPYLEDLKKLLKEKFDIYSNVQKYSGWCH